MGLRVLIVDDNPDDRTLAVRAVRQAITEVDIVEVGTQADFKTAVAGGRFDLVVTDYDLRWSTGIEVLEIVIRQFPTVPVIMFTNTGNEEICAEAMKRGLADYVIKRHGHYRRLADSIQQTLERSELRGRLQELLDQEHEARLAAEQSNRAKEQFLAMLSHELRTPLHAVLGWTSLLRKGVFTTDEEREHALDVIERNARAQANLIEELLDFSRLQSGKMLLDAQEVELQSLVLSAMAAVQPAAAARHIKLVPEVDDGPMSSVRVDPARVRQMVLNLLTNAIKFSPENAEVHVRLERTDRQVRIEVSDRGLGIDSETLEHLFDPFWQADSSHSRRAGGMGIGLALVKKLAEAHGGAVQARSDGRGRGSTFTILLPMPGHTDGSGHAPAVNRKKPPSLDGLKVLAVDDEIDSLRYVERLLAHCQAEVVTARNADRALFELQQRRPDVLVCDVGMPETDGYELIGRIRCLSDEAMARTPAVALTAFARAEDRHRALLAGFDSHIAKPVDGYELIVLVASLAGVLQREQRCDPPGSSLSGPL
jgi:signal transduction histidine kinase